MIRLVTRKSFPLRFPEARLQWNSSLLEPRRDTYWPEPAASFSLSFSNCGSLSIQNSGQLSVLTLSPQPPSFFHPFTPVTGAQPLELMWPPQHRPSTHLTQLSVMVTPKPQAACNRSSGGERGDVQEAHGERRRGNECAGRWCWTSAAVRPDGFTSKSLICICGRKTSIFSTKCQVWAKILWHNSCLLTSNVTYVV